MKRWLKRIAVVFGAFVLMMGLLLGLTQTAFFRDWLKNRIIAAGNEHLNGRLSIEAIEGNFFTHLQVLDMLITAHDDTVMFVPRVRVDLTPSRLLHWELLIDSITIDAPYAKLIQTGDSSWNFANLIRTDTVVQPDTPEETDTSGLLILLNDFILRDGSIALTALDTALPPAIEEIGVRFALQYSDTAQQFALKGLSFAMEKPPFRLEQLSVDASRRGNRITLGNLVIRTARNKLGGEGTYVATDSATSSGQLASEPFDFTELAAFVPALSIHGSPLFEIEARLERDSLEATLGIIEPPQRIDLGLSVANVSKAMNVATHDLVRYYLDIGLTNFDLAHWLGDTAADYRANGTITLAGSGFTAEDADVAMDIALGDVGALGRSLGQMTGTARYAGGDLVGSLDASGAFGGLNSVFSVTDILDSQSYEIGLTFSHLNLAPLLQTDSMISDLNLTALVNGSGFDTTRLSGNAQLHLSPSTFSGVNVDTAFARLDFTADSYRLDTLHTASAVGSLSAVGQGEVDGTHALMYAVRLKSLSPLREMLTGIDTLSGAGTLDGTVNGALDSLSIGGDLALNNLWYNTSGVETVEAQLTALSLGDSLSGNARISAYRLIAGSLVLDSVIATSDFTGASAAIVLDGFYRPGISAHFESMVAIDSTISAVVPAIAFDFGTQQWRGGSPETRLAVIGEDYRIENLILSSPVAAAGEQQTISVAGLFSMTGTEDLSLAIDRLDLRPLVAAFDIPDSVAGLLTASMHLGGSASSPILSGRMAIDSGLVNQFSYRAIHAGFDYEAENLAWSLSLVPHQADSLAITGLLPVNLALDNTGDAVHRDRPFEVDVRTSGLPLSVVQASGQPLSNVAGLITADINIAGTIDAPKVGGQFGLRDGSVSISAHGIEYSDMLVGLSVHDAVITLDTLQAVRDKGILTGSGSLQFERDLLTGVIKTTEFDFLANSFEVIKHKDYQVSISGDARLTGNSAEPRYSGNITILRSSFFLPALMEKAAAAQAMADQSMPMLVRATLPADSLADSTGNALVVDKSEIDTAEVDWFENLRGSFKVLIPRNTWLRSPDMNLEIGDGDLDLVKNGPDFELFGPLRIVRGQYNLYGKVFTIVQGNLLFQGGAEYNPEVSMQAQYVFRTAEREKRTLKLEVSGKAFTPVLQFTLDDAAIEEKDAIAYVMYGRSMDELTSGQQSDAGAAQADLAKGAAANMLSNQLSQTLGSKLGLDVVDINSQGSLASATMTIGKYLTNDLFMSYQRSLGSAPGQEATPDIVTLEYELNKHLFLQLLQGDSKTSGLDFIFKLQR